MTRLDAFMQSSDDGVFIIGHASALVRIKRKLILFDPVWGDYRPYGEHWKFVPEQVNCDSILSKVDFCVVSHIHADHACEDILKRLNCPVLVMGGRPELNSRLEGFCSELLCLNQGQWCTLLADLQFFFVPHAFNSVDSSCFVRSSDYCVYVGNDNFLSRELIEKLEPEIGKVDVALVPYAFIHYYPHLLDSLSDEEKALESDRLKEQSLNQAWDFIMAFSPTFSVPTGASLFYDYGSHHILNRTLATPLEVTRTVPLLAGDYILKNRIVSSGLTEHDYLVMLMEGLGPGKETPLNIADALEYPIGILQRKLSMPRPPLDHTIFVNNLIVQLGDTAAHTKFWFDRPVFEDWLYSKITFEQAIGTRRFTYERNPNVYDLEVVEWYSKYL